MGPRLPPDKDDDAAFLAAVEEVRASANRGELLEHDEVVDRIERLFQAN